MTYDLFCVVNAAGEPYLESFAKTGESSIARHSWKLATHGSAAIQSLPMGMTEAAWEEAKERGDRCVHVRIETSESVKMEIIS